MEDSKVNNGVPASTAALSNHKRQFLAAFVASLGSFGLGTVFGWTSPALPDLANGQELGVLTSAESSWIASLAILGALLSGPISGILINRIGRKILMLLMAFPFTLGWGLMASAKNVPMIYAGRILTGFSGGSFTVTIPVYVSEIATDSIRGTLGSFMVLGIVSGILFTFVFGTFTSWSGLSAICGTIPVIFFFLMLCMPETPRYLLSKGKFNEARNSLSWLRGGKDSDEKQVDLEISKIKSAFSGANHRENPEKSPYLKQLLVSLSLFIFQQFGGINGITMFSVSIFQSAGSPLTPNTASIAIGVIQVIFVLVSLIVVDKVGRKFLLVSSDIVMGLSMLALGTFYYLKEQNDGVVPDYLVWIPLAALITFVVAYSVGAGPLPWLLMGELLPPRAQGFGSSIISSFYWIMAFFSALTFKDHFYHYWIFSAICIGGGLFTYVFVPETKGKTQEEIQRYFGSTTESSAEDGTAMMTHSQSDGMVDWDNNIKADKV